MKFHLMLVRLFGGVGYYNSCHVITKIRSKYYDINGLVTDTTGYLPISEFGTNHMVSTFKGLVPSKLIIRHYGSTSKEEDSSSEANP